MPSRFFDALAGAAVLAAAGGPLSAFAQSAADPGDPSLDRVLVTGVRIPTPIDQVGRSVSVVTAEDIALRQQRLLVDVLQVLPGLQPIRSGGPGSVASVSVRGLPSAQTLVVQDGVVLNNPASFGNAFNFARFDSNDIERVEFLRGAQSTLYGSDAIGGVVNIVTQSGRDGFGGSGYVEGGSFGLFQGAATIFGGDERASARATVSGQTQRGFSAAEEANGNTEDDGFDTLSVSAKARFQPIDALSFDVIGRYQDSRNEFDGFDFATFRPADRDNVAETEDLTLAGFATIDTLDGLLSHRAGVGFSRTEQFDRESGAAAFDATGRRISYEYQGTLRPREGASVVFGVEYEEQDAETRLGFGGTDEIETISGFGLLQLAPVDGVTLNVGVRHDATSGLDDVAKTRDTTVSGSGAIQIPGLGVILRGSYAEGFRAPSVSELALNPNLQSEVSRGWDVGLERAFLDRRIALQATYFDQQIDDLIGFDPFTFLPVNVQTFDTRGVEASVDARVSETLSMLISYTYVDAVNVTTALAAGLQPDHRATLESVYRPHPNLTLAAGVVFNGREELFGEVVDRYVLVNLRAALQVTEALEVFARVENVTDAEYQDNPGFGAAPLSAFGGLRARF